LRDVKFDHTILFILLAPLAAMLIHMAISRRREYCADSSGAVIAGDPRSLANALKKFQLGIQRIKSGTNPTSAHTFLVDASIRGGLLKLFNTHPSLEKRIRRLEYESLSR
jgi:heat shock protein HtpX